MAGEQRVAEAPDGPSWPLWTRVIVAVPGLVAAALVIAGGVYFTVAGALDLRSLPAGDDFASLYSTQVAFGVTAVVFGLLLAAAAAVVSLRRPRRPLLVLTTLFACAGTAVAAYLLSSGADGIYYAALALLAYLASVAVLRLVPARRVANV